MRQGSGAMPRTALAVLEHMHSVKCRWQRWMPPRREFEKWDREYKRRVSGPEALSFGEITVIYYRSFSDLLTERSPTETSAGLRLPVLHCGLNQSTHCTLRNSTHTLGL